MAARTPLMRITQDPVIAGVRSRMTPRSTR